MSPVVISPPVLAEMRELVSLAPDHLPQAIAVVETLRDAAPSLPQVACFDTAFHHTLPAVARAVALPRQLGIERFGFHGLSFEHILTRLRSMGARGSAPVSAISASTSIPSPTPIAAVVSRRDGAVIVRVIATDEELMIAQHTQALVVGRRGRPHKEER